MVAMVSSVSEIDEGRYSPVLQSFSATG